MNTQTIFIVPIEEAKEKLTQWYYNLLVDDPEHIKELILKGELDTLIPDMHVMDDEKVAELFSEFNLGMEYIDKYKVDIVAIKVGDYRLEVVWDKSFDSVPVGQ